MRGKCEGRKEEKAEEKRRKCEGKRRRMRGKEKEKRGGGGELKRKIFLKIEGKISERKGKV